MASDGLRVLLPLPRLAFQGILLCWSSNSRWLLTWVSSEPLSWCQSVVPQCHQCSTVCWTAQDTLATLDHNIRRDHSMFDVCEFCANLNLLSSPQLNSTRPHRWIFLSTNAFRSTILARSRLVDVLICLSTCVCEVNRTHPPVSAQICLHETTLEVAAWMLALAAKIILPCNEPKYRWSCCCHPSATA